MRFFWALSEFCHQPLYKLCETGSVHSGQVAELNNIEDQLSMASITPIPLS